MHPALTHAPKTGDGGKDDGEEEKSSPARRNITVQVTSELRPMGEGVVLATASIKTSLHETSCILSDYVLGNRGFHYRWRSV